MKKRFSDEQIISILREAEAGVSARELCRKHAISDATFYSWRKKFDGMEVLEIKRLKSLEEENARLILGADHVRLFNKRDLTDSCLVHTFQLRIFTYKNQVLLFTP
ncbi:hypothetical protein NB703_002081 [Pantoea ananatis]|uniref:Transposase n=1 Tax=Pantoea ananas TaxID=553 RepID=A0AAJ1CYL6_PANAN|nr:hypothetical protein [Pantoea ananatis]